MPREDKVFMMVGRVAGRQGPPWVPLWMTDDEEAAQHCLDCVFTSPAMEAAVEVIYDPRTEVLVPGILTTYLEEDVEPGTGKDIRLVATIMLRAWYGTRAVPIRFSEQDDWCHFEWKNRPQPGDHIY
jgi:hypothetical protein